MKKTIKINNMTCEHCLANVKTALEAVSNVENVKVSLFRKQAVVEGNNLNDELLSDAVTKAGYEVVAID